MFIARIIGSFQVGLLLALLFTTCLYDPKVCRAQNVARTSTTVATRSQQAKQFSDQGLAAFDRGDTTAAREFFQKALSLNPKEVTAHTYLGIIADSAGDLKEAERHFLAAVKADPNLASARNNYGAILMRTGRNALAAAEFEASLKLDRDQPNALINLAQIRFAGGSPADMRASHELFKRAYAIKPDADIARAMIVISLRLQNRTDAAAYHRDYARLVLAPGTPVSSAASRAELGAAFLEASLLKEAETELSAAVNAEPANQEWIIRLARVYVAAKNLPAAGRTLESAVARGIESGAIYALLAEVYEQTGHPENAIPAMRLAIQSDPKSEKYRFDYAILLTNSNAPAAAVIRLEEALPLFPTSKRLWFALAFANFKLDKDQESERALRRAIELDPKFAPALAYLGLIRSKYYDYVAAISLYERALSADPKLAVVHHLIAESMLKQSEPDLKRVETHLRKAAALDPSFAAARLSLGKLFMRNQQWANAVAELEQVIKLDPNMVEAYYQLGRAYGRLKRTADAESVMATYKRMNQTQKEKEEKDIREVVKRLSNVRF
jgi:Tfp pilus assembly protein PilF